MSIAPATDRFVRSARPIAYSVAAHAACLGILSFSLRDREDPSRIIDSGSRSIILEDWRGVREDSAGAVNRTDSATASAAPSARKRAAADASPKVIPLSALGLRPSGEVAAVREASTSGDGASADDSGSNRTAADALAGGGAAAEMDADPRLDAFTREIIRRIDGVLAYPAPLVTANITGTVSLAFTVDANGGLVGVFENVAAEDRVLKVVVFRALRRALGGGFVQALPAGETRKRYAATFTFRTDSMARLPNSASRAGDRLRFDRHATNARIGTRTKRELGIRSALPGRGSSEMKETTSSSYKLDDAGIFGVAASEAGQSIAVGVDLVRAYEWFRDRNKRLKDPLLLYKEDPDY